MRKYGNKKHMNREPWKYSIGLLGEPGIGKTTIMCEIAEKLVGADGYIVFNMGREQGDDCLEGIPSETIDNWKKFTDVVNDIVKNKETDYPDLKIVLIDTLDQAIEIATPETIRQWNIHNQGAKDFRQARSLKQCWGGFGNDIDYNDNLILDQFWRLKSVGVQPWITGHIKSKETTDPVSNMTFQSLTTDMTQRDFAAFKNKYHLIGIAYKDRTIEKVALGRKNIVTREEVTVNKVSSETRRINFRDVDNFCIDSKSRLRYVTNEIPFNADAFIKALQDAIDEQIKHPVSRFGNERADRVEENSVAEPELSSKVIETVDEIVSDNPIAHSAIGMNPPEDTEDSGLDDVVFDDVDSEEDGNVSYPEDLCKYITDLFKDKSTDVETKNTIKAEVKKTGVKISAMTDGQLRALYDKVAG